MISQIDVVFDINQLRNVCMEDSELMREVVTALIDDATNQISNLSDAVEHADANRCARVAHYVKGACANVGAVSMAALLKQIERKRHGRRLRRLPRFPQQPHRRVSEIFIGSGNP